MVVSVLSSLSMSTSAVPQRSMSAVRADPSPILFCQQLNWLEPSPPTFLCFIFCSVFVPLYSPSSSSPAYAAIGFVENNPVNAAAIKTVAITNVLFIVDKMTIVIISELRSYVQ